MFGIIGGFFAQLGAQICIAHPLHQRRQRREQICTQTQAVTFDSATHGSQGGGEHVHGTELSIGGEIRCRHCIDKAVVHMALIILVHIAAEIACIHGAMVTGDDDGRILVEILLAQPLDEIIHLLTGAGDGIFVTLGIIAAAQLAGKQIVKEIYIPGKIVNIVAK